MAPIVTPAPAPAVTTETAAASTLLWAVDYPDGQDRELTLAEIEKELASGAINTTSLVWREGMAEWLELGQVPELQKLIATRVRASRPELKSEPGAAAPPPPPRGKQPSASGVELPPARAKLPSASGAELPPARAKLPSASSLNLPKVSPEASDAGPPGIPRSPTMAGIGRPPTPPGPLELAVPPAAPAPAFPAAPVMVPAPALAAPFQTQSFARQPLPAVGAASPTANIPDWPEPKSRAPIIIAGVVVVALGIGAAVFFMNRSDDALPPPVPISALPATTPTAPAAPVAAPESTSENAAPTSEAPSRSPGSSAALQPPGSTPITPSNAGFAEAFANGARRADEKAGAPGGQHFDVAAANKALAAASFETAKCRVAGGPSGKATVVVTFEPSGKVGSATVSDAPFAGTPSGECISAALKRATVPPFSGLPGTVTKIISIQ